MTDPAQASQLSVVVLSGAGISADSGVATFRDAGGLWEGQRPEDVATPEAWTRDPELVWRFYQARRALLGEVEPNAGHRALAVFERRLLAAGVGFTLVTQNVDDLHERAGSREPVHMHGELANLRCEGCDRVLRDLERTGGDAFLACDVCGHGRLRPDVVWFGELPYHLDLIATALQACTHFLALGTSGHVYPAAGFLAEARRRGARTWVQALERPENVDSRDTFVPGRSAEALPVLLEDLAETLGLPPA